MEFVVNTDEYMFVDVTETTGELTSTFESVLAQATYSIYPKDEALLDANAKILNQAVNLITGNVFKCRINPDSSWTDGEYVLFLDITDIPGYAEKPRLGPFKFRVLQ